MITDGNQGALQNARQTLLLNRLATPECCERPGCRHRGGAPGAADRRSAATQAGAGPAAAQMSGAGCGGEMDAGSRNQGCDDDEVELGGCRVPSVVVRELEWGSEAVDADVVVAADVVYDHDAIEQLALQLQAQLCGPSGCAFLATAVRCPDTLQRFLDACVGRGLRARLVVSALTAQAASMPVHFHHCCEFEGSHRVVLHEVRAA